jgi:hypothetical protein
MKNATRAAAHLKEVGLAQPSGEEQGFAERTLLVRSLSGAGLTALLLRGELTPSGKAGCFFTGTAWRCPPENVPLRAAFAIASQDAITEHAEAWPGDIGGLKQYARLTKAQENAWLQSWIFRGSAYKVYLEALLTYTFENPRDFLTGHTSPRVRKTPNRTAEMALQVTLSRANDPASWTPEIRLNLDPIPRTAASEVLLAVLDAELPARDLVRLEELGLKTTLLTPPAPLSSGLRARIENRNQQRQAVLAEWTRSLQLSSWEQ